jgi:hypothetical protein
MRKTPATKQDDIREGEGGETRTEEGKSDAPPFIEWAERAKHEGEA